MPAARGPSPTSMMNRMGTPIAVDPTCSTEGADATMRQCAALRIRTKCSRIRALDPTRTAAEGCIGMVALPASPSVDCGAIRTPSCAAAHSVRQCLKCPADLPTDANSFDVVCEPGDEGIPRLPIGLLRQSALGEHGPAPVPRPFCANAPGLYVRLPS